MASILIVLLIISLYGSAVGAQAYGLYKGQRNAQLFTLLFGSAAIGLHSYALLNAGSGPSQLIHILLSVMSLGVLGLAGLQAVLLAIQEQHLRVKHTLGIWKNIPPLETMEKFLFQVITVGFFLLTVLLVSSFYSYHGLVWHQFISKAILAVSTWVVFAVLIVGRMWLGWRGRKAIYFTLSGLFLLACIFLLNYFWIN